MRLFDCNASFGASGRPAFRYARTAEQLIEEMDFCGVDRALVRHAGQRFGSPTRFNAHLTAEIQGHPRLEPAWAILPSQTGEQPPAEVFLSSMKGHGIRTLWAFPDEHRYRLDGLTFGDLLERLVEQHIPLFAKVNALVIGDLLRDFPELTVIAVNQGPHSLERHLRPLLDAYPGLHLESSLYMVEGLIEEFCERYGPHRLMFGSGFPDNCSGGPLLRLLQADVPAEAIQAIAGENLERLLGQAQL